MIDDGSREIIFFKNCQFSYSLTISSHVSARKSQNANVRQHRRKRVKIVRSMSHIQLGTKIKQRPASLMITTA